jgi:uncharacterized membrane protein YraQ (UPF0718 family)
MDLLTFINHVGGAVITSVLHNWPFLACGILMAAALKTYVGVARVEGWLRRRTDVAVSGSVALAVATPFCSCGTTAVVISMLATAAPWAPIVAFMVASPLSSPDELVYSAGLFGWNFALLFFAVSVVLGFAGGGVAYIADRAGLLAGQARFIEETPPTEKAATGCAPTCAGTAPAPKPASIGPGAMSVAEHGPLAERWRLAAMWAEIQTVGPRMAAMYLGFATIGFAAIELIPTAALTTMLGGSSPLSVLFAATLGIPFYLNEGSLPLVASLMHGGMGPGPAMAFLITGAGTSIGAVSGGLLIARWRVLAIVVGTLWIGAIVAGIIAGAVL